MVKLNLNLDEIGTARAVVEPGRYRAKVIEIEEGDSQSGNPMLTWTWELLDGDFAGSELRSYTSLQEHALFGLKSHLEAFGHSGEVDVDTDKLVGKTAILVVTKQTIKNRRNDEDMEVNRIENVLPAGKPTATTKGPIINKGAASKGPVKKKGGDIPF
jgi:hypothetical protein